MATKTPMVTEALYKALANEKIYLDAEVKRLQTENDQLKERLDEQREKYEEMHYELRSEVGSKNLELDDRPVTTQQFIDIIKGLTS